MSPEEKVSTNSSVSGESSRLLQINDLFWTLQGEGRWTGRRALFVRLPFCNYNCPWCDTEYNSFKKIPVEHFVNVLRQEPARFAVITGGEPMAHKDLKTILMLLKTAGFEIACETNGSFPIPDDIDFPTVSPKAFTQNRHEPYFIHPEAWKRAKEFKYVVDDEFDFSILKRHQNDLNTNTRYSLTPEFNTLQKQVPRILNFIQQNPQWQLNLQTHKWINIP